MSPHTDDQPRFDPAIQTEDIAFKHGEMLECEGCKRTNPPNRLHCIYCGHSVETASETGVAVTPKFRQLEAFERGYNVIVSAATRPDTAKIASLVSCEKATAGRILEAGVPLPLARVETDRDAVFLQTRLSEMGVDPIVVADADLAAERPHVRLSRLTLADDRFDLTDFNTGKLVSILKDDLVLIVSGSITESRVDSLEKKRRRGKQVKTIEESATTSDGTVLDLYSRNDPTGFRVHLTGFDFSCLGEKKGMLAGDNLRRLITLLVSRCPNAKLVDTYDSVREALGEIWEIESHKDTKGLLRVRVGKHEFGSVASTSNLTQFTKYSRLQWHLL